MKRAMICVVNFPQIIYYKHYQQMSVQCPIDQRKRTEFCIKMGKKEDAKKTADENKNWDNDCHFVNGGGTEYIPKQ